MVCFSRVLPPQLRTGLTRWTPFVVAVVLLGGACAASGERSSQPAAPSSSIVTTPERDLSGRARAPEFDDVPGRLSFQPRADDSTEILALGLPRDEQLVAWDLAALENGLPAAPTRQSPKLGKVRSVTSWGNVLLVTAHDQLALFALRRDDLSVVAAIPLEPPDADEWASGTFLIGEVAVVGEKAIVAAEVGGRLGLISIDMAEGSAEFTITDERGDAFGGLCSLDSTVVLTAVDKMLLVDPETLERTDMIQMPFGAADVACIEGQFWALSADEPEAIQFDSQGGEHQRLVWAGEGGVAITATRTAVAVSDRSGSLVFCDRTDGSCSVGEFDADLRDVAVVDGILSAVNYQEGTLEFVELPDISRRGQITDLQFGTGLTVL